MDHVTLSDRSDRTDIYKLVYGYIVDYVNEHLMFMKNPNFHNELSQSVLSIVQTVCENIYNEELDEELRVVVQEASRSYFSTVIPRRSYSKTFNKTIINIEHTRMIIERLREVPQNEQRTDKWYEDRWNMISASSAHKALSTVSAKNSLIYEKCKPLDPNKYSSVNVDGPMHWGQKYEPLSILIYEDKYNTAVEDFGCIPHPEYSNIGASPDGINTDPKSLRYGRMVEVKNRFSNSIPITGNPKEEYWVQMQMQMNVCNLNECDFLETRFCQYKTRDEFIMDGSFQLTTDNKRKSIYLYFQKGGSPHYEYPPLNITKEVYDVWEQTTMASKHKEGYEWISYIYWYLEKMSCVVVVRNTKWFELALVEINDVWKTIIDERQTGYSHREATKRQPKNNTTVSGCLIDSNMFNV